MRPRIAAVLASIAVGVIGCGTEMKEPANPFPQSAPPTPATSAAAWPASGSETEVSFVTREEMMSDIAAAERVVNDFWATHWTEFFGGTYVPPHVVGLYDGYASPLTRRVGQMTQQLGPNNAFFCPDDGGDYVAWDVSFMNRALEVGDNFIYFIIAHEWGHAVAYRLQQQYQAQAGELQADCLAGAALYGAAADGTLQFEEGDEREIARALIDLADETPWTDVQDHGDAFQRMEHFNAGRTQGVQACFR